MRSHSHANALIVRHTRPHAHLCEAGASTCRAIPSAFLRARLQSVLLPSAVGAAGRAGEPKEVQRCMLRKPRCTHLCYHYVLHGLQDAGLLSGCISANSVNCMCELEDPDLCAVVVNQPCTRQPFLDQVRSHPVTMHYDSVHVTLATKVRCYDTLDGRREMRSVCSRVLNNMDVGVLLMREGPLQEDPTRGLRPLH